MNIVASLHLVPHPTDTTYRERTLVFLENLFEKKEEVDIFFVITKEDFENFRIGHRIDLKTWMAIEKNE